MCYNKSYLTKRLEKYAKRYGKTEDEVDFLRKQLEGINATPMYHASGFDHPSVPVIIDDSLTVHLFSWGLIPGWIASPAEAVAISNTTINARVETMFEKPAFRESARSKRCIILVDGFFEHYHQNKKTFPYFIKSQDDEPIALAGLWDEWRDQSSGIVRFTYTVVTTRANAMMARIHNNPKLENGPRMPLVLTKDLEREWLKPVNEKIDKELIRELSNPFKENLLESFTVKKLKGKESIGNVPEAIQPFRYVELEQTQGSLF